MKKLSLNEIMNVLLVAVGLSAIFVGLLIKIKLMDLGVSDTVSQDLLMLLGLIVAAWGISSLEINNIKCQIIKEIREGRNLEDQSP